VLAIDNASMSVVPEPVSATLLGMATLGLGLFRRRRR
jgi:MYXO-CTERM domain-containing protein